MSEYIHKRHNVTVLLYHLVFPAKYRKAVFDEGVDQVLKPTFSRLFNTKNNIDEKKSQETAKSNFVCQ